MNPFEPKWDNVWNFPVSWMRSLTKYASLIICLKRHTKLKHAKLVIPITKCQANSIIWIGSVFLFQFFVSISVQYFVSPNWDSVLVLKVSWMNSLIISIQLNLVSLIKNKFSFKMNFPAKIVNYEGVRSIGLISIKYNVPCIPEIC